MAILLIEDNRVIMQKMPAFFAPACSVLLLFAGGFTVFIHYGARSLVFMDLAADKVRFCLQHLCPGGYREMETYLGKRRWIMFHVLVVGDEPAAVDDICSMIKRECPELSVAATAEDGRDGLLKFRECEPDLVISDVKMPVMDGLEMVKAIKESGEEEPVLLLSGCGEFEYMKTALSYGVSDYILKPVTQEGFMAAVEPAMGLLRQNADERRRKLARSMLMGEAVKEERIRRYFPEQAYYVVVMRENGLPGRFTDTGKAKTASRPEDTMFVYGRDEREALYICPSTAVSGTEFAGSIKEERDRKKSGHNFVTVVMTEGAVPREKLKDAVSGVYEEMNRSLSIGVTQTILAGKGRGGDRLQRLSGKREDPIRQIHGTEVIKGLQRHLENQDYGGLFQELEKLIEKAEMVKYPQLGLERLVRQLAYEVRQHFNSSQDVLEEEVMLEDAFYEAGTSAELFQSLKNVLARYWEKDREPVKPGSPEFMEAIREYVDRHLSQELTVSALCREFNLSRSYLNLIFRKHGMDSFNTYLRNARIERAKEIMERNPQMFIKDVAMMVGYKDQFYFSRTFRAVTGISPSGYQERQQASGL